MSKANVAASVRQRLLNRARATGEDYQVLLTRYALERLLYRLDQSEVRNRFILKGAYAFLLWQGESHRQTRDLDLMGYGAPDTERLRGLFQRACRTEVVEDGVIFAPESVAAGPIRDQAEYDGIRVMLMARISTARLPLQVDVGFGDVVTPEPLEEPFPPLLEFPAPEVKVYPRETVVAEKLHGMVLLGMANSRLKDYYDLWYLSQRFRFEGATLIAAVSSTFKRRNTPLPEAPPQALTDTFAKDSQKQQQWKAFISRTHLQTKSGDLVQVVSVLGGFLLPLLAASGEGRPFEASWPAGGPWSR